MAAVLEQENSRNETFRHIINQWCLDYIALTVWEDFSTRRSVDTTLDRDFITGALNLPFAENHEEFESKRYRSKF